MTKGYLDAIHPKNGVKYSPNLQKFLKKHIGMEMRVYEDEDHVLYIGEFEDEWFHGCRLLTVLCSGTQALIFAHFRPQFSIEAEVPDFWDKYLRDGGCAIDPKHQMSFLHGDSRWNIAGDTRICRWCGKVTQSRQRWIEQVHKEAWVNSPPKE